MVKIFILVMGFLVSVSALSFAQNMETKDMKEKNREFHKRESKRPESETSYKNSDKYKNASPEKQSLAERTHKEHMRAIERLRGQSTTQGGGGTGIKDR